MSAVVYPFILKTSTFSIQDCENTFYMSVEGITPKTIQNYKKIIEQTTLWRILYNKIKFLAFALCAINLREDEIIAIFFA